MKKLLTLFLFVFCLVPVITGCSGTQGDKPPKIKTPNGGEEDKNNNQNQVIEIKNGTEVAKILLANERLDASVLTESGTIFTDGKKAMARIIDKTKQYLKRNAGRPNETYTEVDGDTYKWYNDVDYSNFMSFFESYAVNIEDSARRSANLIDYTKKYIRVVNKWVKQNNQYYFLLVNENSETIIHKEGSSFIDICKRYTDENGNSVYEMLRYSKNESTIRMKYIPNLLYEFVITTGNENDFNLYLHADNSKGYWTILSTSYIRSYQDHENNIIENFTPTIMVLKDEANYKLNYYLDSTGRQENHGIEVISADGKTDLFSIDINTMYFFNTGIRGLDHIELTAPKDKVGDYDPEDHTKYYVYEQDNVNEKGEPYKIYSTSGNKSATAVLENGMTLTEGDQLLDGKVTVARVDVSYAAGCESYGRIPLHTTATSLEEQFQILEEFLEVTGITFRRDFDDVINGVKYAIKDAENFGKYYTWNGHHINNIDSVKEIFKIEDKKIEDLFAIYNQLKDLEVIDVNDQEQYNNNIHFADVEIINKGTITNDGFTVSIKDFSVKVEDTLLFVDKEMYKVVFALLNKEGNLISFLNEEDQVSQYTKGNTFEATQSKDITIEMLEKGEYKLVAYVALASEGIRVTNYTIVEAQITESSRNHDGLKNTIKTNNAKELVVLSEVDYNIYSEVEGQLTYQMLLEQMAQLAYNHGMIDKLVIEKYDGENWVIVEGVAEEETPNEDETIYPEDEKILPEDNNEQQETEEAEVIILEAGQYRMKYIVSNSNDEVYVYVTIK